LKIGSVQIGFSGSPLGPASTLKRLRDTLYILTAENLQEKNKIQYSFSPLIAGALRCAYRYIAPNV
jgi:hypothetical protein